MDCVRIGMVGLDTSHATCFAAILMKEDEEHHIPGYKIVAGWPGGSDDFEMSYSRVEGFTQVLQDEYGVQMYETPEEVAEACDIIFLLAADGRVHLELFEKLAGFGKPIFIDKPLACSLSDAEAIVEIANKNNVTFTCSSSLRFSDELQAALNDDALGSIVSMEVWGPLAFVPPIPGYFWYGVHSVEMMVAGMGVGCKKVEVVEGEKCDLVVCEWNDGRCATYRGLKEGHGGFGVIIHREKGIQVIDVMKAARPFYASMLECLMNTLPNNEVAVESDEMLEVVRIMELASNCRKETVES